MDWGYSSLLIFSSAGRERTHLKQHRLCFSFAFASRIGVDVRKRRRTQLIPEHDFAIESGVEKQQG